jgi:hypothetical protein
MLHFGPKEAFMPKNTNVLLIRHGEKPASGDDLAVAGQERAQAYVIYFQNYAIQSGPSGSGPVKLNYLFATANSGKSDRPDLTITPLSEAIGVSIDAKHKDKDYAKVADDILQNSKYDNSNVLICWHHGEILDLATALGVDASKLPKASNWPPSWPGSEYGWLLQLCYNGDGDLVDTQTLCINEQLMYDDQNDPPGS